MPGNAVITSPPNAGLMAKNWFVCPKRLSWEGKRPALHNISAMYVMAFDQKLVARWSKKPKAGSQEGMRPVLHSVSEICVMILHKK